jgi:hypothetical protein
MTQAAAAQVLGVSHQTVGRDLSKTDVATPKVDMCRSDVATPKVHKRRTVIGYRITTYTKPATAAGEIENALSFSRRREK